MKLFYKLLRWYIGLREIVGFNWQLIFFWKGALD